jgi:hypothetical protein
MDVAPARTTEQKDFCFPYTEAAALSRWDQIWRPGGRIEPKHYSARVHESSYRHALFVLSSITYPLSVLGIYFLFWVCFLSFPVTDRGGWTHGRGERRRCVRPVSDHVYAKYAYGA